MTISIDVTGLTALARRQAAAGARVEVQARAVIQKGAYDIQRLATQLAPVDTGALKNSIGIDFADNGLSAVVGPTMNYARYVEYGTSRQRAQPYMQPAADAVLPGVNQALLLIARRAAS